ncbi:hypothetical protein, partial [Xanthomonas sp. GPE 39]|uniref:hypothetical protein n=1 Tax=Xanthomonas sp. GPE 39 TaxID=1583099 RepID=UPI0005F2972F
MCKGPIQHAQLVDQNSHRPTIRDDVVHRDEEDGFVVSKPYQPATDEWALLQRKWRMRLLGQQFLKRFLTIRHTAQIMIDQ